MDVKPYIVEGQAILTIDEQCLKDWFRKYYSRLVYYAQSVTNDEYLAAEIVTTVFMELWRTREKLNFPSENHLRQWLYKRSRYRSLTARLQEKAYNGRIKKYHLLDDTTDKNISSRYSYDYFLEKESEAEMIAALHKAIDKLPPRYKQAVELKLQGFSNDEIAVKLNINASTVRSNLSRATELLQKTMKGTAPILVLMASLGLMEGQAPTALIGDMYIFPTFDMDTRSSPEL